MSGKDANDSVESVAIIGLEGRFPKSPTVAAFWENLLNGVECISQFTDDELLTAGVDPSLLDASDFVKAGSVLADVDMFDALFFGFNARDAEMMDPQHRVFLETAWAALENSGYNCDTFPGLIGVYAGCEISTYLLNLYPRLHEFGFIDHFQLMVGNDKDHLTTHASYKMNLRGPSVACQTACSTSLVAVVTACHSLLSYQCDIALAGGVAVSLPQRNGYFYSPGGIVSPDGHCRAFDAAAQGTVGGNGCALVVLKRFSEAIADGDHIHAVIRGAAINNDGSLKAGYSAPSIAGQTQCIAMAQAMAGIDPATVTYIETHGTGTQLGDPIEIAALTQAFRASTNRKQFCAVGSVKSNVGHLNAAAGVTGLIKATLAVEHAKLPPTLHYSEPNPEIDFANSPFYVQAELSDWTATPRRAGVNSFGIGGTNAHVVLEQAPPREPSSASRDPQLLLLSARTGSALDAAAASLATHLAAHPEQDLADVAYTLQVGRKAFSFRRFAVAADIDDAVRALAPENAAALPSAVTEMRDRPVVFMFPGQGTQYPGMARSLYEREPVFREQADLICELFRPHLGLDLRSLLFGPDSHGEQAAEQLRNTACTQPALFTISLALAALWMKWGVTPAAMIGHSVGEFVAATLAGVLSVESAVTLVALRGRLMGAMPSGSMLAVALPETKLRKYLTGGLSLAAVNAPGLCVISGPTDAIERAAVSLAAKGVQCHRLHTSHAFHSEMMDPAVAPFVDAMSTVQLNAPAIPYISNVSGTWITPSQAMDPAYYGRQLRNAVRFAGGVGELLKNSDWILLEVGPGQTLGGLARQQLAPGAENVILHSLPAAQDTTPATRAMLAALGQLWIRGATIDWSGFYTNERRYRVPVPTYPFERQRYWLGEPENPEPPVRDISTWFYLPGWKQSAPAALATTAPPADWLLFLDETGLGEDVAAALKARGHRVATVRAADAFANPAPFEYTVLPADRASYEALLNALLDAGRRPSHVLHLWSVSSEPGPDDWAFFGEHQRHGFHSLIALAQAMEKLKFTQPLEAGVVTSHLQVVLGDEQICAAKATILGAAKVIAQEYPNVRCRVIDCVPHDPSGKLAGNLIDELTGESFEPVVAYRLGRRWLESFEPSPLPPPEVVPPLLRQHGVYLITGGLGQIGLILAEALAEASQARLVLTGRSVFPSRETWDEVLDKHADDHPTSRQIRLLRRIEELGGEVLIVRADASDLVQMRGAIAQAVAHFGAIHGVIHGAGNTSTEAALPVSLTDESAAAAHFLPKAAGLYILEAELRGHDLDFVLLLSSLSAVLGGLGFAAYAAGNAFLDAFAARQGQRGARAWISVDWDAWQFVGEELAGLAASFTDFILPGDGSDALLRILHRAPRQVVVSTSDLQARLNQWVRLESLRPAEQDETAPRKAAPQSKLHARPSLSSQYAAPRNPVESDIAEVWQNLLGVAPIGVHDKFFELGGHSLLAIQLVSRLREKFQIELPVQRLFEAPTIAELAESVVKEASARPTESAGVEDLLAAVEGMSDEEVERLLAAESHPAPLAILNGEKNHTRQFYDSVNGHLNSSEYGQFSFFLNYGYASDSSAEFAAVELPQHYLNRNSVKLVLEVVGDCPLSGRAVLDVGCGRGGTAVVLDTFFRPRRIAALDLSSAAIRWCGATHRRPGLAFVEGDSEKLPFRSGEFDAVTNIESSHLYPDIAAFFGEVSRVLKPGGQFLYADLAPAGRMSEYIELLREFGFEVLRERDITGNVLLSSDQIAGLRVQAYQAPDGDDALQNFLAAPGSQTYEDLRNRAWTYHIVTARRH
jgi:acyl transferase domain-containing protein/ubiquinone/menaquinone biosynthesis C-methylase UbiE